jgi:HAMP domain-containing protein
MSIVLAVSLAGGALVSLMYSRAASYSRQARTASQRAALANEATVLVTDFFAEASDLALGVARDSTSEEQSAAYGGVNGSDRAASTVVARLARSLAPVDGKVVVQDWESVRGDVYHWINTESEQSGAVLRMTRGDDGRYVASVRTNIKPSPGLEGLNDSDLRRVVRAREDALRSGELRRVAMAADAQARAAARLEISARENARLMVFAIIIASVVAGLLSAMWLYWSIAGPLAKARLFAGQVRAGDLTARIERHQDDEIGDLTQAVEQMKDSVVARLDTMREVAGVVMVLTEHLAKSLTHAESVARSTPDESPLVADLAEARKDAAQLSRLAGQLLDR